MPTLHSSRRAAHPCTAATRGVVQYLHEMSKQRPSAIARRPPVLPPRAASPDASLRYWSRRVFKNSYTRAGKLIRLRSWSVKIQHENHRHTLSLGAVTRARAARKALALYRAIVIQGWKTVLAHRPGGARSPTELAPDAIARAQTGYWRRRLLTRRYTEGLRSHLAGELSARIEYDGENHYFPLGTASREQAARRAAKIYRTVLAAGWRHTTQTFPREITVAVFWAMDPLACTYTTLFTEPTGQGPQVYDRAVRRRAGLVCIVEPDEGVRRAVASSIAIHPETWEVTTLATAEEVLRLSSRLRAALVLLNRSLPDMGGGECAEALKTRRPDLPVFTYGVYDDSDQLFLSFGGVSTGYILRRRPPGLLLEPIGPLATMRTLAADPVARAVRRYFQGLLDSSVTQDAPATARLTPREQEILAYLSKGYVDKEIAQRLGISAWTVHGHLRSIFGKLRVHTRTEAVVRYLQK